MYLFLQMIKNLLLIFFFTIINFSIQANQAGLGIEVSKYKEYLEVTYVFKNSPSYKAGLKQNEFITHINNKSISTLSIDEAVNLLKGEVGSIVEITVLNNDLTSRKLNITRAEIVLPDIVKALNLVNSGNIQDGYNLFLQLAKDNDAEAQYFLGQLNGQEQFNINNQQESFYWTKLSADQNFPDAVYHLATLYLNGIGTPQNSNKAHETFLNAAKLKMPDAYYNLSYNYLFDDGIKKNVSESIKWSNELINYTHVIQEIDNYYALEGYQKLYFIYMWEDGYENYEKAFEYVKILVNRRGTGTDYDRLAYFYQVGIATEIDYNKSFELYSIADQKGELNSKEFLGNLYYDGNGTEQDYQKAFEIYKYLDDLAEYDLSLSNVITLGDYYRFGYGNVNINYEKSLEYYLRGYDQGANPYAALDIGEVYFEGLGLKKNVKEAITWFEIALKSEFVRSLAAEYLGKIYEFGEGSISVDFKKAFENYQIAADDNYSNGSFALGRFYEEGLYVVKDYSKAAYWYQKSAEEGLSTGAKELAELYESGKLGNNKSKDTQYWFQYALDLNQKTTGDIDIISSQKLGLDYILGTNGTKNVELGLNYLLESAYTNPSVIFDFAQLSKNKIISKKQAEEIYNKISIRAEYDNITKISLALIYYIEALYKDQDIQKFEKLINEVIDTPYVKDDIHHAYAYIFLATSINQTNPERAESILRNALIEIENNYINNETLYWSIDFIITTLLNLYNQNGKIYKVEKITKEFLSDETKDTTTYLTKTMLACELIDSLKSQFKYDEALLYFEQCFKYTEDLGRYDSYKYNYRLLEIILLAKNDKKEEASKKYENIFNDLVNYHNYAKTADKYIVLALEGSVNFYLGEYEKSIEIFNILEEYFRENNQEIGTSTLLYAEDYIKVLVKNNETEKALNIAKELLNFGLENGSLEQFIIKKNLFYTFHEIYLDLLFNFKSKDFIEESLLISQISKNSEISQYIKNSLLKLSSEDKELEKLVSERKIIEYQINNLDNSNNLTSNQTEEERILNKNKEWSKLNKQLIKLNKKIEKDFPEFFELLKPKIYSQKEVQEILKPNEVLISTFSGRNNLYIWFITNEEIFFNRVELKYKNLSKIVSDLRLTLSQPDIVSIAELKPFNLNLSNELFSLLFDQFDDQLPKYDKLIFILDGPLQSLPMEILNTKNSAVGYQDASWLIKSHEITYVTSVDDLISFRDQNYIDKNYADTFIAFADPLLDSNFTNIRSSINVSDIFDSRGSISLEDLSKLPSLPETAEEVQTIAKILNVDDKNIYLQKDANENKIKSINLSNSKIISFATHGLINGEIKGLTEPALVLTPPLSITEDNDGLLKSSEIALLNLNAELVLLSACNTAASDGTLGAEGLTGLAKSFFIAGSQSVLVSHWPVFSESTKDTMINLFQNDQNNVSYSKSLQNAKIELIKGNKYGIFSHPSFWSPFVIVGNP